MIKMKNKIKIYLDWNVIVELLEGNYKWLEDILFSKHGYIDIPFSSEHVAEGTNIKLSNEQDTKIEIDRRLNYLSTISSNLYFVNDMINTGYKIETPNNVYQTLNGIPLNFNPDKFFSDLIDFDSLKEGRNQLNLDPNVLNNINPTDAIKKIDEIIASTTESKKETLEYAQQNDLDLSFMGILKKSLEISEDSHSNTSYSEIIKKKKTYDLNNLIVMSFMLLDTFGFWSDKKSTYIRGSRFPDSRHVFNATFMNILISNDKRFCMKAEAVYKYLYLGPEVCYLKEDIGKINDLLERLS
jgi:hypothetical protein